MQTLGHISQWFTPGSRLSAEVKGSSCHQLHSLLFLLVFCRYTKASRSHLIDQQEKISVAMCSSGSHIEDIIKWWFGVFCFIDQDYCLSCWTHLSQLCPCRLICVSVKYVSHFLIYNSQFLGQIQMKRQIVIHPVCFSKFWIFLPSSSDVHNSEVGIFNFFPTRKQLI